MRRYLKAVDKFNEWTVSAFVTPGSKWPCPCMGIAVLDPCAVLDVKFVLLHEGKNDDGIRSFFVELWELYLKVYVASHLFAYGRDPHPAQHRRC